ncbi:MAG: hypothetical protein AAGH15_16275 [Myxococcota bacterium]
MRSACVLLGLLVAVGCAAVDAGDARPGLDGGTDLALPPGPGAGRDGGLTPGRRDGGAPACLNPGETLGTACLRNANCDDGCFCNGVELCRALVCTAGNAPCDDGIACTRRACDEGGDRCGELELDDAACDDDDVCNGVERCDPVLGCASGEPPSCADGDRCTDDVCDPREGCSNPPSCDVSCRPPGAPAPPGCPDCEGPEVCDNFRDDDCDGLADVFDPECSPTNDTCRTAIELSGPGFYGWGTYGLANDYVSRCGDGPRDAVFVFEVREVSSLYVGLVDAPVESVVELRGPGAVDVCEDDAAAERDEAPCDRSRSTVDPADLEFDAIAPGVYWLVVEAESEESFFLEFALGPPTTVPAWDACATAPTLAMPSATVTGDWGELFDSQPALSCSPPTSRRDACYRLELPFGGIVSADFATSLRFGAPAAGTLALVTDPEDPAGTGVACGPARSPADSFRGAFVPAGTYYLIAESNSSGAETFTLDVDVELPTSIPPCEICARSCHVGGLRVVRDVARMTLDEVSLGCGPPLGPPWVDAFYTFTTGVPNERVDVAIDAPGLVLFAIDDASRRCPIVSAPICQAGLGTVRRTVTLPNVGTHQLSVALPAGSGTLSVEVTRSRSALP